MTNSIVNYLLNPRAWAERPDPAVDSPIVQFLKSGGLPPIEVPHNWITGGLGTMHPTDSAIVDALGSGIKNMFTDPTPPTALPGAQLPNLSWEEHQKMFGPGAEAAAADPTDPSTFKIPYDMTMPAPPEIPAPPQQAPIAAPDYTAAQADLASAAPKPLDEKLLGQMQMAAILGGLAQGAGQVDATQPGSFARALAGAGGGGMQGLARSDAYEQEARQHQSDVESRHALLRSEMDRRIAEDKANTDAKNSEIAFSNTKNLYETSLQNKENQYKYEVQNKQLQQPKITATKDSLTIQSYNPDTKQMEVKVIDTSTPFDNAKSLKTMAEASNMPGPVGESAEVQSLIQLYGKQPQILVPVLKRMTIERTLESGAGKYVFGKTYEDGAMEAVKKVPTALQQKPAEYQKELNRQIAAYIFNYIQEKYPNDDGWLEPLAAQGSITAKLLLGKKGLND